MNSMKKRDDSLKKREILQKRDSKKAARMIQ